LQAFRRLHQRVGVRVLSFQIGFHFRVFLVPQASSSYPTIVWPLISVVLGTFFATGGAGSEAGLSSATMAHPEERISETKTSEVITNVLRREFFHWDFLHGV